MSATGERAERARFLEVDALKAAGIVTIVLIHSLRPPWDPGVTHLELFLGHVTRFGVPAFLFASGFLYATHAPVGLGTTGARLRRVLVPYLIASAAAQIFRRALGLPEETGSLLLDLLLGASFGPYYYVFVISLLVLATPLFARLPPRGLAAALLLCVAGQWMSEAGPLETPEVRWHLRNPLLWWAYFLLGWWTRLHLATVRRTFSAHRTAIAATLFVLVVALTAASALEGSAPRVLVRTAAWLDVYAILCLVFVLASPRAADPGAQPAAAFVPGWLRLASDATYTIYLFHLFFLIPVQRALPASPGAVDIEAVLLPWAAGVAGPLALVAASRALLGDRSRGWLGA